MTVNELIGHLQAVTDPDSEVKVRYGETLMLDVQVVNWNIQNGTSVVYLTNNEIQAKVEQADASD